ncbi:hypothetical protein RD1_3264 [Roseobacter denitrificans OCh 114]|uniref:Uncharacterized protein n=1 Tax=Roseobacter denitrificans (strain ATCC 33942 / OCh 114) TaxID=375451 RepID=Q163S8_ROSDO|nr:hypothetical protein RD1_3264 [Roseobacter denitrificans OCh 114]
MIGRPGNFLVAWLLERLTKYLNHQTSRNALKSMISGSVA